MALLKYPSICFKRGSSGELIVSYRAITLPSAVFLRVLTPENDRKGTFPKLPVCAKQASVKSHRVEDGRL